MYLFCTILFYLNLLFFSSIGDWGLGIGDWGFGGGGVWGGAPATKPKHPTPTTKKIYFFFLNKFFNNFKNYLKLIFF